MLVAVGSLHGSPGVTTACVALAAHWPAREPRPTVVECDPAGGDLALRWRLGLHPGLSDAAAAVAGMAQPGPEALAEGVQHLSLEGGVVVPVVCAGPGGAEVRSALPLLAGPGAKVLYPPDATVIADLGRLDPGSAAWPVAAGADLVVLVVEGTLVGAAHLRFRLDEVRALAGRGVEVTIAVRKADYGIAEVADVFRAEGHELRFLGSLGPARITQAASRWRAARRPDVWRELARSVFTAASSARPPAITAGEGPTESECA